LHEEQFDKGCHHKKHVHDVQLETSRITQIDLVAGEQSGDHLDELDDLDRVLQQDHLNDEETESSAH